MTPHLTTPARIANVIVILRNQKVLLEVNLAALYGVTTKALNQAVRRNRARFPPDFMFQLAGREAAILRSQTVTSRRHGGRRNRPYAFDSLEKKYDAQFKVVFDAIRALMTPPVSSSRRIGFR